MKKLLFICFLATTSIVISCGKKDEAKPAEAVTLPETPAGTVAEKNTIVIDGVKTKLENGMSVVEPAFKKSFMHIAQALSSKVIRLDLYFAEKPVTGTYPISTERFDFSNPVKGKCYVSIPTEIMGSGTSDSKGEVKIIANGDDVTVIINDATISGYNTNHTVSVYYTSVGATKGYGGTFVF